MPSAEPLRQLTPSKTHLLSGLLILALASSLSAGDLLRSIPANVPGVITFRDIPGMLHRVHGFMREHIDDACDAVEMADFERAFSLDAETIDPQHPVALVLTKTFNAASGIVVVFKPLDAAALQESGPCEEDGLIRMHGEDGDQYLLLRDGLAYVARSRRPLKMFRQPVDGKSSLGAALDRDSQRLYSESDLFVHLSMPRWQARIAPFVPLFGSLMRLQAAAEMPPDAQCSMSALFDWITGGLTRVINEMRSLSLALSFDGKTFRLIHHHDFTPGGQTAAYLAQVRPSGENLWKQMPDLPFAVVMLTNWRNEKSLPLSAMMCQRALNADPSTDPAAVERRKLLLRKIEECYGQILGSYFLLETPSAECPTMRMMGGNVMRDARKGFEQFRYIQNNAGQLMASILPSGGFPGRFEEVRRNGQTIIELRLDSPTLDKAARKRLVTMWGEGACLQKLVADDHTLLYTMGPNPNLVVQFAERRRAARPMADNPAIAARLKQLPKDANVVILVDAAKFLDLVLNLKIGVNVRDRSGGPVAVRRIAQADTRNGPGPLIGYALVAGKDDLTGQLVVNADDAARFVGVIRRMTSPSTPAPPGPPRPVPVPRAPQASPPRR